MTITLFSLSIYNRSLVILWVILHNDDTHCWLHTTHLIRCAFWASNTWSSLCWWPRNWGCGCDVTTRTFWKDKTNLLLVRTCGVIMRQTQRTNHFTDHQSVSTVSMWSEQLIWICRNFSLTGIGDCDIAAPQPRSCLFYLMRCGTTSLHTSWYVNKSKKLLYRRDYIYFFIHPYIVCQQVNLSTATDRIGILSFQRRLVINYALLSFDFWPQRNCLEYL